MEDAHEMRSVEDYRKMAKKILPEPCWNIYDYPGPNRQTASDSICAFKRYRFRPRVLANVSRRRLATTVLGQPVSIPIGISPTANHVFASQDAEIATAKGAAAAGAVMIQSTFSYKRIKDVAASSPGGLRWMQAYIFRDRRITEHLVREAEAAGYKAIVVIIDSPVPGLDSEISRNFARLSEEMNRYPQMDIGQPEMQAAKKAGIPGIVKYNLGQYDDSLTWEDIGWIRSISSLPIVCKGILTAEAARQAADAGVKGILVSAHGGRQLDGVPAPIDALAEVVEAVRGRNVEVYMDGGVRTGADVLKALARGAKAVFVGRPILWGLACKGHVGVKHVLEILRTELEYAMALCGCQDVNTVPPDVVVHETFYHYNPKHKL
ncbi:2-Hydroxyacid oxidase 1-like [Diadema antillarum]|uniref:2-Hydroxyacid oxidase 1-like n=1 Tax=Diadema antillarum TaxID=105358 RepID=UPI003A8693C2